MTKNMFPSRRWTIGFLALALTAGACLADEPPHSGKFYKLEFVVKEVNGSKVLNTRTYTTFVPLAGKSEIRAGSKIPYASSNTEWQQIDVGVNIDVAGAEEIQDKLYFSIVAEVSSIAGESTNQVRPIVRQNRWQSMVVIPLKKPTILFSSDNLDSKTQLQVEVTATPIP